MTEEERVIVDEPGYLRNLTTILQHTKKRYEPDNTDMSRDTSRNLFFILKHSNKRLTAPDEC